GGGAGAGGLVAPAALAALASLTGGLTAGLAAALPATAALTTLALGLGDLGGGVAQRRADLVDLHLHDRAVLALRRLPGAGDQAAGGDDPGTAVQRLGGVLGRLAPDRATHEQRLPVLPVVGLTVERAGRRGHGEVGDGRTAGGEAQLGIGGEVADHGDGSLSGHVRSSLIRGCTWGRCRWRDVRGRASGVATEQLGPQDGLVEPQLAVQ